MYVGLDVHKKFTEIAILDESGVILRQDRVQNDPESIESFSKCLSGTDIVIESLLHVALALQEALTE